MIRVQFDDQIMRTQPRGGVSRYFVELVRECRDDADLGVAVDVDWRSSRNEHAVAAGLVGLPVAAAEWPSYPAAPVTIAIRGGVVVTPAGARLRTSRSWRKPVLERGPRLEPEALRARLVSSARRGWPSGLVASQRISPVKPVSRTMSSTSSRIVISWPTPRLTGSAPS